MSFVAEIGRQIVSLFLGHLTFLGILASKLAFTQSLIIHPDYPRQYIGYRPFNAVLGHSRVKRINTGMPTVTPRNGESPFFIANMGLQLKALIRYTKTVAV